MDRRLETLAKYTQRNEELRRIVAKFHPVVVYDITGDTWTPEVMFSQFFARIIYYDAQYEVFSRTLLFEVVKLQDRLHMIMEDYYG